MRQMRNRKDQRSSLQECVDRLCRVSCKKLSESPFSSSYHSRDLLSPAGNSATKCYDFPLPDVPPSVEAAGGFFYPNSNGFQYEAAAVYNCIRSGKTSCPMYPPGEMVAVRA